jgi:hypothetical protein
MTRSPWGSTSTAETKEARAARDAAAGEVDAVTFELTAVRAAVVVVAEEADEPRPDAESCRRHRAGGRGATPLAPIARGGGARALRGEVLDVPDVIAAGEADAGDRRAAHAKPARDPAGRSRIPHASASSPSAAPCAPGTSAR